MAINLEDFFTLLTFPSVSADPKYKDDVLACGNWVAHYLKGIGFEVEVWQTSGFPTVFASHLQAGDDKPTLLIYNHYDVQPVDPLEEWVSAPFTPEIRDGEVYARGAQDNKGQLFFVLEALKAELEETGKLPVNIKLCIEGEEETGSTGLSEILETHREKIQADFLAVVDVGIPSMEEPAVTIGVRGIVTMDVEVSGSEGDLHSGSHGGLAFNPIHALTKMLAHLRDDTGRVMVPGFYESVEMPHSDELESISLDFDEEKYEAMFGMAPTGGEQEFPPIARAWLRPTLEVNGISGGYAGEGFKTVIPAKATAKISCRLVPNQEPQAIAKLVANFLEKKAPDGVKVSVNIHPGGGCAVRANPHSKITEAFSKAYSEVFALPCRSILEGGSIPIVTELASAADAEVALVGLGLPDDQIHAPNEHFGVDRLEKGAAVIRACLHNLGMSD